MYVHITCLSIDITCLSIDDNLGLVPKESAFQERQYTLKGSNAHVCLFQPWKWINWICFFH